MVFDHNFRSYKLGRDPHNTFVARVVSAKHWKPVNDLFMITGLPNTRVKIRLIGDDPSNQEELSDEDCRWAIVSQPGGLGGGSGGRGETISYVGGETVHGFFLDGDDRQQPVITGCIMPSQKLSPNTLIATTDLNALGINTNEQNNEENNEENNIRENYDPLNGNAFSTNFLTVGDGDASMYAHNYSREAYSSFNPAGVSVIGGSGNLAENYFVENATNDIFSYDPCGSDTVSKVKNLVDGFIKKTQSFEEFQGKLIDPLTNEIINMQYDIQVIQELTTGILGGATNMLRKKIIKKINKEIKKKIIKEKTSPEGENKGAGGETGDKQSKNAILDIVNCIFSDVFSGIGAFIGNMFTNLLNNVLNGALCAVEQFIAGIFVKIFDTIEKGLSKAMSGLSSFIGKLDSITGLVRNAGSLAKDLLEFLDKCTKDSEKCAASKNFSWSSMSNSSIEQKKDDWEDQFKKMNVFREVREGLEEVKENLIKENKDVSDLDYNGVPLKDTMNATSILTGGSSNALIDKGLGSIESAISNSSIFGLGNNRFDPCNAKVDNPNSQDDLTPTRPGFIYPKCIPPVVKVSGSGSGAELFAIVGNDRRIFSIEVINGGSGYDESTGLSVIDNTGNGIGAFARPIVNNGVITQVVLMKTGYGYCLNTTDKESPVGIGTNVVGVVQNIFVEQPGFNYNPNDTITIGNDNLPIITSPNGALVGVTLPPNYGSEFSKKPNININTQTGFGASLIPIMKFKGQLKTDVDADKRRATPLIGIDHVIDCIGDNRDPIGFVNGIEYSGPYHVMSSGVKMTGATHSGSDSIIYDTIEESLGKPSTVSSTSIPTTPETVETPETTTPVDSTPTIVTTPTTPTTTMDTTTSTTDTTTGGSSDPTPPNTPPSGGGGYGGY